MFEFKGDRKYVHGTDLYEKSYKLLKEINQETSFIEKISFKKISKKQCFITLEKPETNEKVCCDGIAKLKNNACIKFWWIESNEEICSRYTFNEESITSKSTIESEKNIEIENININYKLIEIIVSLTKKIHYNYSPDIDGKWLFAQLNLYRKPPEKIGKIKISIITLVKNKFSVSDIAIDNLLIGNIRFIVGEAE